MSIQEKVTVKLTQLLDRFFPKKFKSRIRPGIALYRVEYTEYRIFPRWKKLKEYYKYHKRWEDILEYQDKAQRIAKFLRSMDDVDAWHENEAEKIKE